jgi:hypothetical protein
MMSMADIERITKVLESMIQYELMLSDLYKQCADIWTEDQLIWQNLAYAEIHHAGLKDNISRLTSSAFSCEKMLVMARDIEQSILESHYAEIVKTADPEYQALMKGILSQTYEHKKIIQEKIEAMKTKA